MSDTVNIGFVRLETIVTRVVHIWLCHVQQYVCLLFFSNCTTWHQAWYIATVCMLKMP